MILENQTTTNREALINELESLQSQISSIPTSSSYKIGDAYEGYIIGAIYDYDSIRHAIIISPNNSSEGIAWSNLGSSASSALSTWDGQTNTFTITEQPGFTEGAAKSCLNYTEGGFEDWYLGAIDEWLEISKNLLVVNRALEDRGFTIISPLSFYWTSTEDLGESSKAYIFGIDTVTSYVLSSVNKTSDYIAVRPLRMVQL